MRFAQFVDFFSDIYETKTRIDKPDSDVYHLVDSTSSFSSGNEKSNNIVYFYTGESETEASGLPLNTVIICNSQEDYNKRSSMLLDSQTCNVLFIISDNPQGIYSYASDIFMLSNSDTRLHISLLEKILSGGSLSETIEEASTLTGRHLVALDRTGKIIAHSNGVYLIDKGWQDSMKNGYCPNSFMDHAFAELQNRSVPYDVPAPYFCEETQVHYLSLPIESMGKHFGYVFMMSKTPINDYHSRDILLVIHKAVTEYLKKYNKTFDANAQIYKKLYEDILQGASPKSIKSRIISGKLILPKRMVVILIRAQFYQGEEYYNRKIVPQLSNLIGTPVPQIYFNSNLLMVLPSENDKVLDNAIKRVCDVLKNEPYLQAGMSNTFSNIEELTTYYHQAEKAIEYSDMTDSDGKFTRYRDISLFSLLEEAQGDYSIDKMEDFCHPLLERLKNYDKDNKTDLFDTLKAYTECGFSQALASQQLHIHRNTLKYRKQQIMDIMGVDFETPDIQFSLMLSFKIHDYIKKRVSTLY